jgi:tRNA nucleotidyltransferase (CCA-adding enzyme)
MRGLPRMYADDTNIIFQINKFDELEDLMNIELAKLKEWLNANKLSLNVAKTEFMVIGSRQRLATFDDHEINVFVCNDQIKRVNSSKSLGLKIYENLTWKRNIDEISK